jgi:EF-P beta-lysylation protein EpmB
MRQLSLIKLGMVPATTLTRQPHESLGWQQDMASAVTNPGILLSALGLDPSLASGAAAAAEAFAFRVPWSYIRRMRHGDVNDPLLRQVLPVIEELDTHAGYVADPLGERNALRAPALLHKYERRALLITTSACAVHCRYCFRREFPYAEQRSDSARWNDAIQTIANDPSIEEVILSGGDPLSLSDRRLESLTDSLARIPHIRRLRVHTRQPIVLPSRVDDGLIAWLGRLPWRTVFVLHANHANELDVSVREACDRLRASGVTLLNQSVLLKGINDSVEALKNLSAALFDAGVMPYYLHLLDHVRGTAHFEVDELRAQLLVGELASQLSGYLVPRLVREVAGAPAKVPVPPRFPPQ